MIWKVLIEIDRVFFWILAVLLVLDLFGKGMPDRPPRIRDGGRVEFGPSWSALYFVATLATWLPTLFISYASERSKPFAWAVPLAVGLGTLMLIFDLPGTVVTDNDGIEEVYWLRKNKRIAWKRIMEIESSPKSRTLTIRSADGTKIVHSFLSRGRSRMLLEIRKHCGDNLPADFPREPLDVPGG